MEEFDITIWALPHRFRFPRMLVYIDSDFVEERKAGFLQYLEISQPNKFDFHIPFIEFPMQMEDLQALQSLMNQSSYPLQPRAVQHATSENIYGIRINRSSHVFSVEWRGRLGEEDRVLTNLYNAVAKFSERSGELETKTLSLLGFQETGRES